MAMRRISVCAVIVAVLAVGMAPADALVATDPARPLHWEMDPDGDGPIKAGAEVEDSLIKIARDEEGVSFRIRTTGLSKGHGYTVWFFSFDRPELCRGSDFGETNGGRCTHADLFFNPAAGGSLMWGRAGKFAKSDGVTSFAGRRPRNPVPCATEPAVVTEDCSGVLIGRGLANPLTAEIQFVLRDHGPDQPEVDDETRTINGGCDPQTNAGLPVYNGGWGTPGNFACYDPQGTF